ncbi:MAG TPA: 2Fe-2S iron-sulfur cluster-binding protein [Polyangiaceae bacterium]|nr:2Fe-2S iron-sulfur cluster-binding protein [Polyangiaceae bacterium]
MPTFKLDGKTIPFEPGDTIIQAAYREGIEIPHYCWHPGLSAPANCRMCLVEILPKPGARPLMLDVLQWDARAGAYRTTQKPKLQPACYTAAADGMDVRGDTSEHARKARHDVQEFLLLNHPVDCPICDQSGECKLQDYWLEYGQYQKRMRDEPVHKPKGVVFGPTIVYDGERCVMCTRCTRFMAEVAKDPVLDMRERGNLNEIFVAPGRQLDGHYTFMTEHVCPVGALTTKDFRFKARVWFLKTAPAICQGCATGCNAHLDYDPRYSKVYRYRPRDNEKVNKYWMCDEGMLSYKEAHEGRLLEPKVRGVAMPTAKALEEIKSLFAGVPKDVVAIVLSASHSLEDNWALLELGTVLLGAKHVYVSGRPDGYADDILIHRDKNSNTRGVMELAPNAKPLSALVADAKAGLTHVLALGGAAPSDVGDLRSLKVVTVAAHEGPLTSIATVALPAASWAEASGTYVNAKGIRQGSEKALEPQGASKPAWRQLADVAAALGFEATWSKLRQIRTNLIGTGAASSTPALSNARAASAE